MSRTSLAPLGRFSYNEDGNVAMTFGLMAVPMILAMGLAVDTGRVMMAKTEMKSATDAAAMAAATAAGASESRRTQIATTTYQTNINPSAPASVPAPQVTIGVGFVRVEASSQVDYSFTKVLEVVTRQPVEPAQIEVTSVVTTAGKTLELALMLDVTGSMDETSTSGTTKISDLKYAANDLLDIVMPDGGTGAPTRVSLVPFSSKVNVGSIAPSVTGYSATYYGNQLVRCATERTGTHRFTDAAPTSGQRVGPTAPGSSTSSQYSSNGACRVSTGYSYVTLPEIKPLSSDKTQIKNHINAMTTGGGTAGHLGTAWAWYTLSPNWNSVWTGTDNDAADYAISRGTTATNIKAAILMTDGEYNTDYSSNYSSSSMAAELCTRMKNEGITVYTIGFGIDNDNARNILRNCASVDPQDPTRPFYFFPYSRAALAEAFRSIGQALSYAQGTARLSE